MIHTLVALFVQVFVAQFMDWWTGAALASAYFVGREFAQAENRAIVRYYHRKRANAPWWVGFQRRAWNPKAMADWLAPTVAVGIVAFVHGWATW